MDDKKYKVIYADPPWKFRNKKTGGSLKSGADAHYSTMTLQDLKRLRVDEIADDDCVLFMWWVASMPAEALAVVEAWGFKLKTMTGFSWFKTTTKEKPFFGMGFWTRAGSENCLIAVKGKPKRVCGSIRSCVVAKNEKHSKKPDVFRDRIVGLIGDVPRIELFARERAEGWDCWGLEVDTSDLIL